MANTTNFNWETPDDTDLVKDGAAAIRTLGSAIDTSLVDLKGGTTGQILSKATNTDMDFTWITNDVGDITAVTAGTGISGGGTSGAVTITNSMATAIDAKGDLIVGTGADTFSRLAVGATNGHILTIDSAEATGLKWAAAAGGGGMTLLSTTTLSGTSTTISVSASSYLNLMVIGENVRYNGNDNGYIEFNATANLISSVFSNTYTSGTDTGPNDNVDLNITYAPAATGSNNNTFLLNIFNQSQTSTFKNFNLINSFIDSSSRRNHKQQSGQIRTTSAITQLKFYTTGAAFGGGTIKVYGVN